MIFAAPVDAAPFAGLPGVSDVEARGATISLRLLDGMDAVIKLAAKHTLVDMSVENPSLDEVFLGYYDKREQWQA